ncbi:hypothetical protein DFH06DRAFT_1146127 [Mycena polygramma]|nr:hypothetical protein DFH06DRAFT_1146127 [Mycena polygramma]
MSRRGYMAGTSGLGLEMDGRRTDGVLNLEEIATTPENSLLRFTELVEEVLTQCHSPAQLSDFSFEKLSNFDISGTRGEIERYLFTSVWAFNSYALQFCGQDEAWTMIPQEVVGLLEEIVLLNFWFEYIAQLGSTERTTCCGMALFIIWLATYRTPSGDKAGSPFYLGAVDTILDVELLKLLEQLCSRLSTEQVFLLAPQLFPLIQRPINTLRKFQTIQLMLLSIVTARFPSLWRLFLAPLAGHLLRRFPTHELPLPLHTLVLVFFWIFRTTNGQEQMTDAQTGCLEEMIICLQNETVVFNLVHSQVQKALLISVPDPVEFLPVLPVSIVDLNGLDLPIGARNMLEWMAECFCQALRSWMTCGGGMRDFSYLLGMKMVLRTI